MTTVLSSNDRFCISCFEIDSGISLIFTACLNLKKQGVEEKMKEKKVKVEKKFWFFVSLVKRS